MFKNSVCVTYWIKLKCFFLQEKQSKVTSRSGLRWRLIPSQEVQSTSTRENTGDVRKNPIGPAARLFSYSWCDTLGMFKIPKSNCDGRQENWENCDNERKSIGLWIENWLLCEWVNELVSEWMLRSEGGRERVFYWAHCSRKQYDVDIFLSYRLNDTWFLFIQFGAIVYVLCTCGLSIVTKLSLHRPILLCFTFLSCLVFLFRFKAIFILWINHVKILVLCGWFKER